MSENEFRVRTDDGEMTVFEVCPDTGGPFPVAFLYMDGVGYREQLKENARRFAADGYYVVAPDLFYRFGEKLHFDMTRFYADEEYRARLIEVMTGTTPEMTRADTEAVLAAISDDPAAASGPRVCVGYCMGARLALHVASMLPDEFVAVAGIHPGALVTQQPDSPHHELASVRAEVYFGFAGIDDSAPPEVVESFRAELVNQGVKGEVERLDGAQHGYSMVDLPVYDREAAEHHFEKTLALWRRALAADPVVA